MYDMSIKIRPKAGKPGICSIVLCAEPGLKLITCDLKGGLVEPTFVGLFGYETISAYAHRVKYTMAFGFSSNSGG